MQNPDILILGAGIAGASLAAFIAPDARIVLLEAESSAGYHTTGRSAAFFVESYGGPQVQPLSRNSKTFLQEGGFLHARGALHIATDALRPAIAQMHAAFPASVGLQVLERVDVEHLAPMLRAPWQSAAVWEPDCADIDVARLHQDFLTTAKRAGAELIANARVYRIERRGAVWCVTTRDGIYQAPILVNAAGAWGDEIADLAHIPRLGLSPKRRTMISFQPAAQWLDPNAPIIAAVDGSFYFKPESGMIWASPHDEIPSAPCDAQPEELDIAITVDRIEQATFHKISRIQRSWAGLRTFTPDRAPAYGFDPHADGFFWCVGQGGFGIQTAPAAGQLCADILCGRPSALDAYGIKRFFAPTTSDQGAA
jgi:D-arginine dehydrogenase